MIDLYIYYKVAAADAASLLPRVLALQSALAARHGVAPQLKRRPEADPASGQQTWMEVYPAVAEHFAAALDDAARAADLFEAAGARHSEMFTDLKPCA
jgi:hypothetical protein